MLAAFYADEYGLERAVADRVIDQALALVHVPVVSGGTENGLLPSARS